MNNSKLTFQYLFQRYLATFSLQSRILAIFSSRDVNANLVKSNYSNLNLDNDSAHRVTFLNSLYKFQNNYEIERLVSQKFSKSDAIAVDGVEAKFHKKELELR